MYPCTITIKQDDKPLEGASVQLYDPTVTDRWSVSGLTDSSGTATIHTHGRFPGVPQGQFKVVISKTVSEGETSWDDDPAMMKPRGNTKVYSLVGKEYTDRESTPLEIVIDGKKRNESFDIGSGKRVLIQTIRPGDM